MRSHLVLAGALLAIESIFVPFVLIPKGTIIIFLKHFYPLMSIKKFICSYASEISSSYFELYSLRNFQTVTSRCSIWLGVDWILLVDAMLLISYWKTINLNLHKHIRCKSYLTILSLMIFLRKSSSNFASSIKRS